MISWPENEVTEPLLLKYVFSDLLKEFIRETAETELNRNMGQLLTFPNFLVTHKQLNECETGD